LARGYQVPSIPGPRNGTWGTLSGCLVS